MPLDFRPATAQHRHGRSRPPNRWSRSTQHRLLMLLGLLALVLLLMYEARKPGNWRWLWALQQAADSSTADGPAPDTRLREPDGDRSAAHFEPVVHGTPQGPVAPGKIESSAEPSRASASRHDPLQRAAVDAWSRLLNELSEDQRQMLLRGLKAARDQHPLTPADRADWLAGVDRLDEGWQDYLSRARQTIQQQDSGLTDKEKHQWAEVVRQLEEQWQGEFEPALKAIADAPLSDPGAVESAETLQRLFDQAFLKHIADNMVFRSAEKDIWFRLLDDLSRRDADQLRQASSGRVSFVQLYEQPNEYRGRLVTVNGTSQLAYYRQAPENLYEIPGYYVFWLRPVGVNSPIVVYSLEVPAGFPNVLGNEARGQEPSLDEELEFTGYFFKRWAYAAKDGTRLAPLLLAKSPTWQPRPASLGDPGSLPGPVFWAVLVGGTGLFGASVAVCVWWFSRRSTRPRLPARPPHTAPSAPP